MKLRYGKVTLQVISELTNIVGRANISAKKHDLEEYSRDEMPAAESCVPQVLVKPADTASVARIMDFANKKKIPVTPRGAGTGLSGGCVPLYGGILLSLERMNRIVEIDKDNFVAVVEPGVTLADLYTEVESQGFYYPLYPGEATATIGGNIATNAGGMNAIKYGVTRHNVLGLEAVLPNGKIIETGGKFVKCSTGYDLTQLIIGSEGTLVVVTRAILKLTTRPAKRELLFASFTNLQDAIDAVPEILSLRMTPIGIEFMERSIIEIAERYTGKEIPHHQYEAFLLIIMEGESEGEIHRYFSSVEEICKRHGAVEAMVPASQRAQRKLLDMREKFYHAVKKCASMELIDVVVPRSQIGKFVRKVKAVSEKYRIPVVVYGHAGDGNVHLHPLCLNITEEQWNQRLPKLMKEVYEAGISLGGAISGEHGIGLAKKGYLRTKMGEATLETMKQIKKAFDPNNILNPGKIFDLEI